MSEEYIAHVRQSLPEVGDDKEVHKLEDHLRKVARRSEEFAKVFEAGDWAYLAGLWHDLGKYRPAFQKYIRNQTGIDLNNAHIERNANSTTRHASSGAIYAIRKLNECGLPLAYAIAGHHAGLPDYDGVCGSGVSLMETLERDKPLLDEALKAPIPEDILEYDSKFPQTHCPGGVDGIHLWIRMLFSCLVDADFLDTEAFMEPKKPEQRHWEYRTGELLEQFNRYMDNLTRQAAPSSLNVLRAELLQQCREAAKKEPGIYTLTIPTGGGKTLSSLAFALEHAVRFGKKRTIYAIPYTSIIEQTADVFKEVFASLDVVLEHHSNIEPDKEVDEDYRSRLATENWDAPVIVTTTVQFFESLFAARTSRCRKLHNICNSVVILDEVQLLPPQHLDPIRKIIKLLADHYGVTFVFSTATPTGLNEQKSSFGGMRLEGLESTEIVTEPPKYYSRLQRVQYELPDSFKNAESWEDLAEQMQRHETMLAVVNKRQDAKELFALMPAGTFHLSALMCPEHRSRVIREIKARLSRGEPTRVISTQLVEAGVDFDFPVVYRALAGLDSIIQAGGRCNREGKLDTGKVIVFNPPSSAPPGIIESAITSSKSILHKVQEERIDAPDSLKRYFIHFFHQIKEMDITGMNDLLLRDAGCLQIQFRTAARKFKFIEDEGTHTVYVRYDNNAEEWLDDLKFCASRELLRQLQRYSVSVYDCQYKALLHRGDIELTDSGYAIQVSDDIYHSDLGLITAELTRNLVV